MRGQSDQSVPSTIPPRRLEAMMVVNFLEVWRQFEKKRPSPQPLPAALRPARSYNKRLKI
jgi:hypothetical protein